METEDLVCELAVLTHEILEAGDITPEMMEECRKNIKFIVDYAENNI